MSGGWATVTFRFVERVRFVLALFHLAGVIQRNVAKGMAPRRACYEAFQQLADGIVALPEMEFERKARVRTALGER